MNTYKRTFQWISRTREGTDSHMAILLFLHNGPVKYRFDFNKINGRLVFEAPEDQWTLLPEFADIFSRCRELGTCDEEGMIHVLKSCGVEDQTAYILTKEERFAPYRKIYTATSNDIYREQCHLVHYGHPITEVEFHCYVDGYEHGRHKGAVEKHRHIKEEIKEVLRDIL